MKTLEVSEQTYNNFMKFKQAVEENSWEKVTEDEVLDFMIRAIMSSVELGDEDEGEDDHHCWGDHCCWHCHHH